MKEFSKNIIFLVLASASIILFALGVNTNDVDVTMVSVLILFAIVFVYSLTGGKKNIVLTAFLVCFFTFLLGDWGIGFLAGERWGELFDRAIIEHVLTCIYISLFAIFIGAMISRTKDIKKENSFDFGIYREESRKYENVILVLFYLTLAFNVAVVLEKVIFTQTNSYSALYTEYKSSLPGMIYKLAECNDFMLYSFMAVLPDKKKAKKPFFIHFVINVLSLFSGVRGGAVKAAILLFAYCYFRNLTDEEPWVKKKHWIALGVATPVAIVLLSLYNVWRNGNVAQYDSFWKEFVNFFRLQGKSIDIIGYEKKLHNVLPATNTSYFFGPIIQFAKHGFIGKIVNGILGNEFIDYAGNTIGEALYDNNLGATITYLVIPQNYLAGRGLGTQYIAEACADFGYMGVVIFNLILGFLLVKCRFIYFKKWYLNVFLIYMVNGFLGISRNFALAFLPRWVSVLDWALIGIIIALSRIKLKKYGGIKDENTLDL